MRRIHEEIDILDTIALLFSFSSCVTVIHHPTKLSFIAFQLRLDLMTVPQSLCDLFTPHVIMY